MPFQVESRLPAVLHDGNPRAVLSEPHVGDVFHMRYLVFVGRKDVSLAFLPDTHEKGAFGAEGYAGRASEQIGLSI